MDNLYRMYLRLLQPLEAQAAAEGAATVTIGDLYQTLIPYRLVRAELGFSELKEYEHTLLRLLAGEGGFLEVELPDAVDEFRRELASPNPILGIYRDYAAVGVAVGAGDTDPLPPPRPASEPPPAPPPPPPPSGPTPRSSEAAAETGAVEASAAAPEGSPAKRQPVACVGCGRSLPGDRRARFCPFCGVNQVALPCDECGALLEPTWWYCIECGSRRTSPGSDVR
jgi:RNA polymerase subunit RPABC4/transcription elongation factor Spt4